MGACMQCVRACERAKERQRRRQRQRQTDRQTDRLDNQASLNGIPPSVHFLPYSNYTPHVNDKDEENKHTQLF